MEQNNLLGRKNNDTLSSMLYSFCASSWTHIKEWTIWIVVSLTVMIFVGPLHISKQWSLINLLNLFSIDLKGVSCFSEWDNARFEKGQFQTKLSNKSYYSLWNFNYNIIIRVLFRSLISQPLFKRKNPYDLTKFNTRHQRKCHIYCK